MNKDKLDRRNYIFIITYDYSQSSCYVPKGHEGNQLRSNLCYSFDTTNNDHPQKNSQNSSCVDFWNVKCIIHDNSDTADLRHVTSTKTHQKKTNRKKN